MDKRTKKYNRQITEALDRPRLLNALHRFRDAFLVSREKAFRECDFDSLRKEIKEMKDKVIENNGDFLDQFATNAEKAGAYVFFAQTAEDANRYITELAIKKGVKKVVKSKSMVSEEIDLNRKLMESGVSVNETDLGEWIVQLADQRPSHMVMPAIHMFRDQVAELFSRETGRKEPPEIEHLVNVARKRLRKEYLEADMGITG
ncbi:MAG: LUD domain-containing protein, partial [Chitinispirillia bacterium]